MKMPKYAKLQNARRPSTKENDKRSRLAAIINSAFFLWCLTAVCVTFGGAYFSQVQKCMADADVLIDRYYQLVSEITARENRLAKRVKRADSVSDVTKAKTESIGPISSMKDKTTHELYHELNFIFLRAPAIFGDEKYVKFRPAPINSLLVNNFIDNKGMSLDDLKQRVIIKGLDKEYLNLRSNCSPRAVFRQLWFGKRDILQPEILPQFVISNPED